MLAAAVAAARPSAHEGGINHFTLLNLHSLAFFVMVHLPYLQPFEDDNKRVSRLAANVPLIKSDLCPLSFVDVPERAYVAGTLGVYEMTRVELLLDVWAYQRSCQRYVVIRDSVAEPDLFRMKYQCARRSNRRCRARAAAADGG